MKLTELYAAQLEREATASRKALERVPEGRNDWKPHAKSMPLGYLATLVATMEEWIHMAITKDELDLNPPGGQRPSYPEWKTAADLVQLLEASTQKSRDALAATTDEHLMTPWKLLVGGQVVMEKPRHIVIEDTFTHLAHHRGQLTVYLRLNEAAVPAIYGPSADDRSF